MNKNVIRWILGLALLAAIALTLIFRKHIDAAALESWIQAAGIAGPLLFMALYVLATLLFLPGSVLTLVGGALFGPLWGTLWNLTGATTGAALSFLTARYLGADWVERRAGPRLNRLNDGVTAEGWRFVAFVRLVPLFPFNLLNYALGLTRINFPVYLLATWIFMLPGAIAYTFLGYAGREAVSGGEDLIQKGLIALALLAAVAFLPRLISRLREMPMIDVETLKELLDKDKDMLLLDVRTAADFVGEQGHLATARNLPLEQLPEQLELLELHQERLIALICRTDRRSAKASAILARAGFADVHIVRGGMTAWHAHGWAVEDCTAKKKPGYWPGQYR